MEYWYAFTGPKHWQDLHVANMQSQLTFIDGVAPNGQKFQQGMNIIFEPIQLARVIIPSADVLPALVNTLGGQQDKGVVMNLMGSAFRKILGLQPIPQMPPNLYKFPVSINYLNIIPIGIKDEPERIMATTGVKQNPI